MSKDTIDRAIKKAQGNDAETYDEIRYEGYGPGGVAVIVEVLTDNRNRTASDVRSYFTKTGGNLAETGAVSFMFDHVGVDRVSTPRSPPPTPCWKPRSRPAPTTCVSSESGHEVYASQENFAEVREGAGGEVRRAAQGRPRLEAAEHGRRRRREGREARSS